MDGEKSSMVGGTCSYKSLCNYNANGAMASTEGVPSMQCQLIGGFAMDYPPKYDTLSHGGRGNGCGGFFKLKGAYPCSAKDKTWTVRPCTTSPAKGADCWKANCGN